LLGLLAEQRELLAQAQQEQRLPLRRELLQGLRRLALAFRLLQLALLPLRNL
jgi:hypothetical protein